LGKTFMKNCVADGNTIDFIATAAVASGEPVLLGKLVAVSLGGVAIGEAGVGATEGVFELPKVTADDITQGGQVYIKSDGMITSVATGNTAAGKAWAAAGNPSDTVWVKVNA
jgi:predicted RecA/RadA family phage recombinase